MPLGNLASASGRSAPTPGCPDTSARSRGCPARTCGPAPSPVPARSWSRQWHSGGRGPGRSLTNVISLRELPPSCGASSSIRSQISCDDAEVRPFVVAADVVGLARRARASAPATAPRHGRARRASRARSCRRRRRDRLARQHALDHHRDQLLRELIRAVVVRAVGDDRRPGRRCDDRRAPACRSRPCWPSKASSARRAWSR